ncbi:unnamed protein product [Haemonchus placei]|uniref:PRELI/MSF1 domain-containing protein n=1 Tax=Haemonchus placei TaxID=6290 RepID=A0A0N4VWG9_HAEPC|nr:unnamed protein product [Haemonchus placei]
MLQVNCFVEERSFIPNVDEALVLSCILNLQDYFPFLFLQVIEESIYDRRTRTLTTYTRNVSHNELFAMHERCVYRPTTDSLSEPMTDIMRSVYISIHCGRMSSVYEKLMLLGYKKSVVNTGKGLIEVLEQRFGMRNLSAVPKEKMKLIRDKLLKSPIVSELKCDEK